MVRQGGPYQLTRRAAFGADSEETLCTTQAVVGSALADHSITNTTSHTQMVRQGGHGCHVALIVRPPPYMAVDSTICRGSLTRPTTFGCLPAFACVRVHSQFSSIRTRRRTASAHLTAGWGRIRASTAGLGPRICKRRGSGTFLPESATGCNGDLRVSTPVSGSQCSFWQKGARPRPPDRPPAGGACLSAVRRTSCSTRSGSGCSCSA